VSQDEVESQLSAMFDGELPATECELLSRRIDRDENLRARWSRYALMGAAMRSEPVATARSGFARRVSVALRGADDRPRPKRGRRVLLSTALAATMVVAVAGLSISLLRDAAVDAGAGDALQTRAGSAVAGGTVLPAVALRDARETGDARETASPVIAAAPAPGVAALRRAVNGEPASNSEPVSNGEPVSYVTPVNMSSGNTALRTELADFIVAHSVYSTPLMRRNLLSALVSNEDGAYSASTGVSAPGASAPGASAAGAPAIYPAGAFDASTAASRASH
jgi:anti-sigma factor RsiW